MPSRAIIFRVLGIPVGQEDTAVASFVSVPVAYLPSAVVCVTDCTDSYGSDLRPFVNKGSWPSMTIKVLANSTVCGALMWRASTPVRSADGTPVTTLDYVGATRPATITVTDSAPFAVHDFVSLGLEAVRVTAVPGPTSITVDTSRQSEPVAHPWQSVSEVSVGTTIYSRIPGIEGVQCTVSTVWSDAGSESEETLLFRGVVSDVSHDTSAGGENQIVISIANILSKADQQAWAPRTWVMRNQALGLSTDTARDLDQFMRIVGFGYVSAPRTYVGIEATSTSMNPPCDYVYSICGDSWALWKVVGVTTLGSAHATGDMTQVETALILAQFGDTASPVAYGRGRAFQSTGTTTSAAIRPDSPVGADFAAAGTDFATQVTWQECVSDTSAFALVRRVLCGVDANGDEIAYQGVSAGVPVDSLDAQSLLRVEDAIGSQVVSFIDSDGNVRYALPPLTSDSTKLVDFLVTNVLAPAALAVTADGPTVRFFGWAQREEWPTIVTIDNGLSGNAEPTSSMTFGRSSVVQVVRVKAIGIAGVSGYSEPEVNYVNQTAASEGGGQTLTFSTVATEVVTVETATGLAQYFRPTPSQEAVALTLIGRYGRSAPTMRVTLRDRMQTLWVGQQVLVTNPYVLSAAGTMGLTSCRGVVIRSTRKWLMQTTQYDVLLWGYSDAIGRPPMWAPCGRVTEDLGGGDYKIEQNYYTRAPVFDGATYALPVPGMPATDATAFEQSIQLESTGQYLVAVDQYGTQVDSGARLAGVVPSSNMLSTDGGWLGAGPSVGDTIMFAPSTAQGQLVTFLDFWLGDPDGNITTSIGTETGWEWLP